jgi:hypothetical protein
LVNGDRDLPRGTHSSGLLGQDFVFANKELAGAFANSPLVQHIFECPTSWSGKLYGRRTVQMLNLIDESTFFNSKPRDEFLNGGIFFTQKEVQVSAQYG